MALHYQKIIIFPQYINALYNAFKIMICNLCFDIISDIKAEF
jgi:hypothetical protein